MMNYQEIEIAPLLEIVKQAGEAIMKIYAKDFDVQIKTDNSPLTEADRESNKIIIEALKQQHPNIPLISEENKLTPFGERKNWKRFWLIDPLDGTKEFIKKNGEFTVNVALIEEGTPVIGVVGVPAHNKIYFGVNGFGSYISENNQKIQPIANGTHYLQKQTVKVVASRSHLSNETLQFVEELKQHGKQVDFISSGSSLKFCLVAEGKADVYPRFGPTMEWDTAAAHAVALYAGKSVHDYVVKQPLIYNKENLLNPWFLVE
jgi:3'(2'), 5'-bisphosphate nucleotidase